MLTRLKQSPVWQHPLLSPVLDWPWSWLAAGVLAMIAFNALAFPLMLTHSVTHEVRLNVDHCTTFPKHEQVCQVDWTDHGHHYHANVEENGLTPGGTTPGWITPVGLATEPVEVGGYGLGLLCGLNAVQILVLAVLGRFTWKRWHRVRGSGVGG